MSLRKPQASITASRTSEGLSSPDSQSPRGRRRGEEEEGGRKRGERRGAGREERRGQEGGGGEREGGEEGRKGQERARSEEGRSAGGAGRSAGGAGRGGMSPRSQLVWLDPPSAQSGFPFPSCTQSKGERGRAAAAAAAMWPPDPEPDPDREPAGRSQPHAALPGLRALLPARAFLCSLKGRLLLAETVSAGPWPPPGGAETPAAAPACSSRA